MNFLKIDGLVKNITTGRKRRVILASVAMLIIFSAGVAASPVLVRNISNISSSEHKVGGAHLAVTFGVWVIDANSSTVEGVLLRVTNTDTQGHTYQMVVQVSCLSSGGPGIFKQIFPPKPFICAGGQAFEIMRAADGTITTSPFITLGPGNSTIVGVNLDRAIEPERTQIEDLSFIVTELPLPTLTPAPVEIKI